MSAVAGLFPLPQVTHIAQTIQLAVAPVFMLAGIGAFLNLCAGRLARVIDRARMIEKAVLESRGEEHDRLVAEIRMLDRRMGVVNSAIFLSVASGCAICLVVILLFAAELFRGHLGNTIAVVFIMAMILQAAGFATFIQEIRLASRTIHIRNEVLFHQVDDEADA